MPVDPPESFQHRHLGPRAADLDDMLEVVRAPSLDVLIDETIPEPNRLTAPLDLPPGETEAGYLERLRGLAAGNRPTRSYIGLGYYGCVTPSVILRNVLENPGWYTPYTPYQAEVAQGRLEALLNFQTMVEDLTGMEVANASLLDEATAAAEAMTMLHRIRARKPGSANRFVVSDRCLPQTIDVMRGRAAPLGLELVVGDLASVTLDEQTFGVLHPVPRRGRRRRGSIRRGGARAPGRRVRRGGNRPACTDPVDAAGRVGCRRGGRQRPTLRCATRLWRAASRLLRDAPGACAPDSRPPDRRVGGRTRADRVPHGAPDARAAHPARTGHLEHLHGAGAAGEHRRVLRRISRSRWADGHRPAGARAGPAPGARTHATGSRPAARLLLRHVARGRWVGGGARSRPGCGGDGGPQLPLRRRH